MFLRSLAAFGGLIVENVTIIAILDESHAGQVPHERREALLALPQCFDGFLVGGDVAEHGDGATGYRPGGDAEPDAFRLSVRPKEQFLRIDPLAAKSARERQL